MAGSLSSLTPNELQQFTATGRPYKDRSSENSSAGAMGAIMGADTFGVGNGPPNVLPFRYTDDSLIMVPVLKTPFHRSSPRGTSISSSKMSTFSNSLTIPGDGNEDYGDGTHVTDEKTAAKERKSRKFSLGNIRRRSKSRDKDDFEMREMTRGEYLKHYAKDDDGRYIGSEEPAADCILRLVEDVKLYRS